MGTEPIQNLAITTSLSLLLSGNNASDTHSDFNYTYWSDIAIAIVIAIAQWKRDINPYLVFQLSGVDCTVQVFKTHPQI